MKINLVVAVVVVVVVVETQGVSSLTPNLLFVCLLGA